MICVHYREGDLVQPNTFVATLDGPIVHIRALIRRNDVSKLMSIGLHCYVSERDTIPPKSDLFLDQMTRLGAEAFTVHRVPLGDGIAREQVHLIGVPEVIGNAWHRAVRPGPRSA